jgi:hypothetical protein
VVGRGFVAVVSNGSPAAGSGNEEPDSRKNSGNSCAGIRQDFVVVVVVVVGVVGAVGAVIKSLYASLL